MPSFCVVSVTSNVCYVCLSLIRIWSLKVCFPVVYCTAPCQKRVCAVIAGAHPIPAPAAQCLTGFWQMIYCSAALYLTAALFPLALATVILYPASEVSNFMVTKIYLYLFFFFLFFYYCHQPSHYFITANVYFVEGHTAVTIILLITLAFCLITYNI